MAEAFPKPAVMRPVLHYAVLNRAILAGEAGVYAYELKETFNYLGYNFNSGTLRKLINNYEADGLLELTANAETAQPKLGPERKYFKVTEPGILLYAQAMPYFEDLQSKGIGMRGNDGPRNKFATDLPIIDYLILAWGNEFNSEFAGYNLMKSYAEATGKSGDGLLYKKLFKLSKRGYLNQRQTKIKSHKGPEKRLYSVSSEGRAKLLHARPVWERLLDVEIIPNTSSEVV